MPRVRDLQPGSRALKRGGYRGIWWPVAAIAARAVTAARHARLWGIPLAAAAAEFGVPVRDVEAVWRSRWPSEPLPAPRYPSVT